MPKDLVGDKVEIRFTPEHNRSLRGALAQPIQRRVSPEGWEEARNIAWAEAALDAESQDRRFPSRGVQVVGKPPA